MVEATHVIRTLNHEMGSLGLEFHPFKIGWYNDHVEQAFQLPHPPNTLAIVVISTPAMFEALFLPYLMEEYAHQSTDEEHSPVVDPLDSCMRKQFNRMKRLFPTIEVETMQDFELLPSRRPRVLVQTAGHVAGAAYYYQSSDVEDPPWPPTKTMYGVSVHPKYGGWFALRGVLVFNGLEVPTLSKRKPLDCVNSVKKRVELLVKFNDHWRDWEYRNVLDPNLPPPVQYSEKQKLYFGTEPASRKKLVSDWLHEEEDIQ